VDAACAVLSAVQPRQRIGVRAANSVGFVIAVHALMRLGAVLVPINTRLTAREVAALVDDASVSTLLQDTDLDSLPDAARAPRREREFDLDALHSILYTSGTSGRSKGALLTYDNHYS